MKILAAKGELTVEKQYPGLFECRMTHKISETSAVFKYGGPKFTDEMWNEILAFFKWSYAKTHGESQVRLFVHPTLGWKAWAFPQEASSGLATHELPDNPETKTQRAQFGDGWILYGTVHHHCSAGAFQSGTDEQNERDQEGLHITVGDIDKDVHTLDCRFYFNGCKFQPDMKDFWDVGMEAKDKADELADYFGIEIDFNKLAEAQMRHTCDKDTKFPDLWMANLIEKPKESWERQWDRNRGWNGVNYGALNDNDPGYKGYPSKAIKEIRSFVRSAYKDEIILAGSLTPVLRAEIDEQVLDCLEKLREDSEFMCIIEAMTKHNCDLDGVIKRFEEIMVVEQAEPPTEKEVADELAEEQAEKEDRELMEKYGGSYGA
jgi:hypothetical protein